MVLKFKIWYPRSRNVTQTIHNSFSSHSSRCWIFYWHGCHEYNPRFHKTSTLHLTYSNALSFSTSVDCRPLHYNFCNSNGISNKVWVTKTAHIGPTLYLYWLILKIHSLSGSNQVLDLPGDIEIGPYKTYRFPSKIFPGFICIMHYSLA